MDFEEVIGRYKDIYGDSDVTPKHIVCVSHDYELFFGGDRFERRLTFGLMNVPNPSEDYLLIFDPGYSTRSNKIMPVAIGKPRIRYENIRDIAKIMDEKDVLENLRSRSAVSFFD